MKGEELLSFIDDVRVRIKIDDADLVNECKKQPAFFEEVSSELARLKSKVKTAKGYLAFVKARLEGEIRSNPEEFKLTKTTDLVVAGAAIVHSDYKEAESSLFDVEGDADALQAVLLALEQRKSMLRDLVTLYVYNYTNSEVTMRGSERLASDIRAEEARKFRAEKAEERRREEDESKSNGES